MKYAFELARHFGAQVILVHVVENVVYPTDTVRDFSPEFPELKGAFRRQLETLAGDFGARAETAVCLGRPWKEIVNLAKRQRCDLIVLGTHGYTGWQRTLLGSVAEKVVRHAPCPVLTIRSDAFDRSLTGHRNVTAP